MKESVLLSYESLYQESAKDPEKFWATQAQRIQWFHTPWTTLIKNKRGLYR